MPITVTRTTTPRADIDFTNLPFGRIFSDHMFTARYQNGAWQGASIEPLQDLRLHPAISALQYGQAIFEGLKAFRQDSGKCVLFRVRDNAQRFARTASRMAMPPVPEELFVDGIRELVRTNASWIPPIEGGALYVRPFMFGIDKSILVKPADEYLFVILTCPVTTYFSNPVRATTAPEYVRAFEGGTGFTKPAGNYGAAMAADREAKAAGFDTVLWLDGQHRRFVEECGVMNVVFVIGDVVVTPPLTGTILPGITRDSVLRILRDAGLRVEERPIPIEEIFAAADRGDLREGFGTGTAATVVAIASITHAGRTITLRPLSEGTVAPLALERLTKLRLGRTADPYGWLTEI